jgi:hypothetical protein
MSFGHWHSGHYLWGNVPAVDCLQILNNEGPDAVKTNFMFAFAGKSSLSMIIFALMVYDSSLG